MNVKPVLSTMALTVGMLMCHAAQANEASLIQNPQVNEVAEPMLLVRAAEHPSLMSHDEQVAPQGLPAQLGKGSEAADAVGGSTQTAVAPLNPVAAVVMAEATPTALSPVTATEPQAVVVVADAKRGADGFTEVTPESAPAAVKPDVTEATEANDVLDAETPDPYERTNRSIYNLNDAVDKAVVKPVAKGYQKIIPKGPRLCASNMFSNLGEPYTAVNNLLQGKPKAMLQDIGRLLLNSTLGIGGCIDVASQWGIPKHEEDFGQTLAVWGVPSGPYVVLPGFGPSTVRDALSRPVDFLANPIGYITHVPLRNSLQGYKLLNTRTSLLEITDVVDESALDPYVMMRDAWLQRRMAQIKDEDGGYAPADEKPRQIELAPRSAVIE